MSSHTQESRSNCHNDEPPLQSPVQDAQDVVRVVVEGDGDVQVQEHQLTGKAGSLGEEDGTEEDLGSDEEDASDEEDVSDEQDGSDEEDETDEEESENAVEEQVLDMAETEIAINGLQDLGSVNFKELSLNDILRYHFPDREVGYMFYSWYARMHVFAARKSRTIKNKVGEVIQQTLVCFIEGKRKDYAGHAGEKRKRFPKKDTRCECKATLKEYVHCCAISEINIFAIKMDIHSSTNIIF